MREFPPFKFIRRYMPVTMVIVYLALLIFAALAYWAKLNK